jgi:hypothetical protein
MAKTEEMKNNDFSFVTLRREEVEVERKHMLVV